MKQIIKLLGLPALFSVVPALSQNVQQLTLETCETLFLKNNLMVLAEQYNISAKQALVLQAKVYPNPVVSGDFNVYDPQNRKYFHVDSGGQKTLQVEQLILLGGKRKKDIEIAKQNALLAESEFQDLLRNLKRQLNNYFYDLNSQAVVMATYQKQMGILDTIIRSYKIQADKGNLPLKDLIRLKSVYIKLNSAHSDLASDYNENQKQIKLLLSTLQDVVPVVTEEDFKPLTALRPPDELLLSALESRPDLKIANESTILASLLLEREKKQAIPDIAISGSYDQRGGAFNNQINAGFSIPLPLLNRNKGNIRAAAFTKKATDLYLQDKRMEVELDVQQAWLNMQRSINEYVKVKGLYNEEFSLVNAGVSTNFKNRNITILEFVDFVESYNEAFYDYEKIKRQLAKSAAQINHVTGTKIY